MDELLNNRIVLFFVGLAIFFRIAFSTAEDDDNHTEYNRTEFLFLLDEIRELRQEIKELKEQTSPIKNSTRIESGDNE